MRINIKYLFAFIALLITEVIIGLFVHDKIIRPYIGDVLVVILIYTFIRGVVQKPIKFLPVYIFLFSVTVEFAQYFNIVNLMHLQNNKLISTIIGTSFSVIDILCYLIATVILVIYETVEQKQ